MARPTIDRCLQVLAENPAIHTLDLTGGAPELHADFEHFVEGARALDKRVIVRHNLTVALDPHPLTGSSMRHLPAFFREQAVEVVASLPCYTAENTDRQRGRDAFAKSIESLRLLNAEGFGIQGTGLVLELVHNPLGPSLPGCQEALECDYRRVLAEEYGVSFTRLLALANMPVNRFAERLLGEHSYDSYLDELASAFNPDAAQKAMCRAQISVGWDGTLYDCDFNQSLGMSISDGSSRASIFGFDAERLRARQIRFASHCLGCTAGQGSSCRGATV